MWTKSPVTTLGRSPLPIPADSKGHNQAVKDEDDQARLQALEELNVLDTSPEERFDRVTRLCVRLFGVPMALASRFDIYRQWFMSNIGKIEDIPETPRDIAFCYISIQDTKPL